MSRNARAKFDEWFNKKYRVTNEEGEHVREMAYVSWKAGRESMRQEIIPLVYGMCESDNVAARTVEAIRKIEA